MRFQRANTCRRADIETPQCREAGESPREPCPLQLDGIAARETTCQQPNNVTNLFFYNKDVNTIYFDAR